MGRPREIAHDPKPGLRDAGWVAEGTLVRTGDEFDPIEHLEHGQKIACYDGKGRVDIDKINWMHKSHYVGKIFRINVPDPFQWPHMPLKHIPLRVLPFNWVYVPKWRKVLISELTENHMMLPYRVQSKVVCEDYDGMIYYICPALHQNYLANNILIYSGFLDCMD